MNYIKLFLPIQYYFLHIVYFFLLFFDTYCFWKSITVFWSNHCDISAKTLQCFSEKEALCIDFT